MVSKGTRAWRFRMESPEQGNGRHFDLHARSDVVTNMSILQDMGISSTTLHLGRSMLIAFFMAFTTFRLKSLLLDYATDNPDAENLKAYRLIYWFLFIYYAF